MDVLKMKINLNYKKKKKNDINDFKLKSIKETSESNWFWSFGIKFRTYVYKSV